VKVLTLFLTTGGWHGTEEYEQQLLFGPENDFGRIVEPFL
jgi:hypothetical protein